MNATSENSTFFVTCYILTNKAMLVKKFSSGVDKVVHVDRHFSLLHLSVLVHGCSQYCYSGNNLDISFALPKGLLFHNYDAISRRSCNRCDHISNVYCTSNEWNFGITKLWGNICNACVVRSVFPLFDDFVINAELRKIYGHSASIVPPSKSNQNANIEIFFCSLWATNCYCYYNVTNSFANSAILLVQRQVFSPPWPCLSIQAFVAPVLRIQITPVTASPANPKIKQKGRRNWRLRRN
jgi:hypothetical protein